MISLFTRYYVKKQAKKKNIIVPSNYIEILSEYCKLVESYGYKLHFRWHLANDYDKLGANAGFFNSPILVTTEWAARLVLENTEEVRTAFLLSLGHELTHKEKDIYILTKGLCSLKFSLQINEVHADYGAVLKFVNSNRALALMGMNYKMKFKNINKESFEHPSWLKRKEYIQKYNFDEQLIRQIAEDVGCKNETVIKTVINHFDPIILDDK